MDNSLNEKLVAFYNLLTRRGDKDRVISKVKAQIQTNYSRGTIRGWFTRPWRIAQKNRDVLIPIMIREVRDIYKSEYWAKEVAQFQKKQDLVNQFTTL